MEEELKIDLSKKPKIRNKHLNDKIIKKRNLFTTETLR